LIVVVDRISPSIAASNPGFVVVGHNFFFENYIYNELPEKALNI
jgi:hypothetical protein